MITVIFFGRLKDVLGCSSVTVDDFQQGSVRDLRAVLQAKGENWQELLQPKQALVAVNQVMSNDDAIVGSADEVAFFPPVTGG